MKVPYFRAKVFNWKERENLGWSGWVEGAYFQMRKICYGIVEKGFDPRSNLGHYIVTEETADWNLPNRMKVFEIDPSTLEKVGEWEV